MSDVGHDLTDGQLVSLQGRIESIYRDCGKEMLDEAETYWAKFKKRDASMREKLEKGIIDKAQYTEWKIAQIGRGKNLETMAENLSQTLLDANQAATALINDTRISTYALNRNWTSYYIESALDGELDVSFSLYDEATMRRLLRHNPDLMPDYTEQNLKLDVPHDLAYSKEKITSNIISGILQGKSIPEMASSLASDISDMGKVSATRAARTAITGAENAGRQDSYNEAISMGIKVRKMWMCTHDRRTRASHIELDGIDVDVNKSFPNKLDYPGDRSHGRPDEVYNCRCTMVAVLPQTSKHWKKYNKDNHTEESYKAWEEEKRRQKEERRQRREAKKQGTNPVPVRVDVDSPATQNIKPYTQDEKDALAWYVSGDGMWINQYERGNTSIGGLSDDEKALRKALDTATSKNKIEQDTLWRSIDIGGVFQGATSSDKDSIEEYLRYGDNKRGKSLVDSLFGKPITEKGFMSTTTDKDVAFGFGDFTGATHPIALELSGASNFTGVDIASIGLEVEDDEQHEILLGRNHKYSINDFRIDRDEYGDKVIVLIGKYLS